MNFLHELLKIKFPKLDISRQYLLDIIRDNNITRKRATFKHFPKTFRGNIRDEKRELKEFFEMRMGTAQKPEMKMVADLVEEDKSRITLAGGSFPDLSGDGQITQKDILIGRGVIDRDDKQSGGLAAILGV